MENFTDFNRDFNLIVQKNIDCLQPFYTTILSHDITCDGKFLLATVKNNKLAIFPLEKYLKDIYNESVINNENNNHTPHLNFAKLNRPLPTSLIPVENSLCFRFLTKTNGQYKFCLGGKGSIKGYRLSSEQIQECDEEWSINLANDTLANCMTLMKNTIACGCGDNNIYLFDQETRQQIGKLSGHQDYIHDLKCSPDDSILYSSSEDGSVRQWDVRSSDKPISSLFPYMNNKIRRLQFGKWIGALDISSTNEWLLCGGGPALSIWHVRSDKCAHIIDIPGVTYSARFMDNNSNVMAAGSENMVTIWRRSDPSNPYLITSSIRTIYSISHYFYEQFGYNLFSFGGDSYQIEICENAKFIDWKLSLA